MTRPLHARLSRPARPTRPYHRGRRRRPPAVLVTALLGAVLLALGLGSTLGVGALSGLMPGLGAYAGAGLAAIGPYGELSDAVPHSGAPGPDSLPAAGAPPDFATELPFGFRARSVVLIDADSGQVLTESNAGRSLPMASITKLMTMRLVLEAVREGEVSLDQKITVSANVQYDLPPYSSRMFLAAGDQVTVSELLYGAAVSSGNDACIALAELVSGSQDRFVEAMNLKAAALGLGSANFADAHGYSPENRISASDLAAFARGLLAEFPEVLGYTTAQSFTYSGITQYNHNHLIWTYAGCDGLKTGYTRAAGYSLVATAERDGHRLIAVMLGVPQIVDGRWGWSYRDRMVSAILDWGFDSFDRVAPLDGLTAVLPVFKGGQDQVDAVPAEDVAFSVPAELAEAVKVTVELAGEYAVAPIAAGQPLGTAIISVADQELDRVTLVADQAVPRGGLFRVVWDSVRLVFRPGD